MVEYIVIIGVCVCMFALGRRSVEWERAEKEFIAERKRINDSHRP